MKIIKRDKSIVDFESMKIVLAIEKAMMETEIGVDYKLSREITVDIITKYNLNSLKGEYPTVEQIQDDVEYELMTSDRKDVAKRYILYRSEREKLRIKGWEMNELQRDIYENKYKFECENFDSFLNRVSGGNQYISKLIRNQDFLFAGRILAGRGLDRNVTLSNCYVLPQPQDNLESIFDIAKESARTYSYGGGCGFDISLLRPNGSPVNNSALTTSGAVSFMELYDTTTSLIGQKGRRGALMISMSVHHPDIVEFINVKRNVDKINSANISVRFDDEFFNNLDKDNNKSILQEIAKSNWESGEPGALFWDKVEDWHLLSEHPEYVLTSTNPCGEQPLPDYGNCLLGSINLGNFVSNPYTSESSIDYKKLKLAVENSVIGLNEVLDEGIPLHPLKQQQETARNFRQIGLGIMGFSDMLIKLGVRYGSDESIEISHYLGFIFRDRTIHQSVELAKKHGSYPKFDKNIVSKSSYFKDLPIYLQEEIMEYGMRNSHVLSIAPTGTLSTMLGISGGIEPIFAKSYSRTTKSLATEGDVTYKVYTSVIEELMNELQITNEEDLPNYVVTSHEINPIDRIKVQGAWQRYVDSAISSTINLNEDATIEDIQNVYINSWKHGLKGVTVFRNNCFRTGILNIDNSKKEENKNECPVCGGELTHTNGCNECVECAYSACSL